MSQLPSDLTFRVGQDYTTRQLYRAALRNCRANFWPALGYLMLASLIIWVPVIVIGSCIGCLALPLFTAVYILAGIHLMSGYGWSAVCTFDNRRMRADDLFYGFRTRYGPLALLGLLEMVAGGVPTVLLVMVGITILVQSGGSLGTSALSSIGFSAAWVAGLVLMVLIPFAAHAFFFMSPLFMFTGQTVTWRNCLRDNWRVMRHRTKAFLAVFLLPLVLLVVLGPLDRRDCADGRVLSRQFVTRYSGDAGHICGRPAAQSGRLVPVLRFLLVSEGRPVPRR